MELSRIITLTWLRPIATCVLLFGTFVGSLYVWKSGKPRDDPTAIKRRFIGVIATCVIAPVIVYATIDASLLEKRSLAALMGVRFEGLLPDVVLPLFLTSVLYLGPLALNGKSEFSKLYTDITSNRISQSEKLAQWRDYVVGPVSEEVVFRASMLPVLLQSFSPSTAIFICSFFFGIAHIHHFHERLQAGYPVLDVIVVTAFQCCFSTAFGAYSAYIFVRTGHLLAPCLVHSFCNFMGVPDFREILKYKEPRRCGIALLYIVGVFMWLLLLQPLTKPELYSNDLFWVTQLT